MLDFVYLGMETLCRMEFLVIRLFDVGSFDHQLTCSLFSRTPNVNILKIASSPPRSAGLTNIGGDFDSIVSKGFVALISIPGTINNSYVYLLMRNSFSKHEQE